MEWISPTSLHVDLVKNNKYLYLHAVCIQWTDKKLATYSLISTQTLYFWVFVPGLCDDFQPNKPQFCFFEPMHYGGFYRI